MAAELILIKKRAAIIKWKILTMRHREILMKENVKLHSFGVWFYIFSTLLECIFRLLHSFRVDSYIFPTRFECIFQAGLKMFEHSRKLNALRRLLSRVKLRKLHSKRVEKMRKRSMLLTLRIVWQGFTLETSGKDVKPHSKRVEKM